MSYHWGHQFIPAISPQHTTTYNRCFHTTYNRYVSYNTKQVSSTHRSSPVAQLVKNLHAILGSVPGLGRSPGEGEGYPLQCSCLENAMDCIVHGVAKSRTQLSNLHFHFQLFIILQEEFWLLQARGCGTSSQEVSRGSLMIYHLGKIEKSELGFI